MRTFVRTGDQNIGSVFWSNDRHEASGGARADRLIQEPQIDTCRGCTRKDIVEMESLLVNAIIAFWLVAFGAMALFPLLLDVRSANPSAQAPKEDLVISIQPVGIGRHMTPIEPLAEGPCSLVGAHDLIGRTRPGDGSGMATEQRHGAPATVRAQLRDSHLPATPKTIHPTRRRAA